MNTNEMLLPGEVPVLRTCRAGGLAYNDFRWPLEVGAVVQAPDWSPEASCGRGLHGFLRGEGDGSLACWGKNAVWMIVAATDVVKIDEAKVKFPRCRILHVGDQKSATDLMQSLTPSATIVGATVTAGDCGTATAGDCGTATAGDCGTIIVKYWDGNRYRLIVGYVGEDGIEANVKHRVEDKKLVRA